MCFILWCQTIFVIITEIFQYQLISAIPMATQELPSNEPTNLWGNNHDRNFELMSMVSPQESIRRKRYVLSKEKWPKRTLRWKLHSNRLSPADMFIIRTTLHRAFEVWSSVSSLRFIEIAQNNKSENEVTAEPTDIDILFLKGKHGDGLPFDGPQGVVAHAFYPPVGALHFDADENWTLNRPDGINFYQTAVHEIGHLLGLEHSSDFRAVMYPRNREFEVDYQLADDDVRAIRRLPEAYNQRWRYLGSGLAARLKEAQLRKGCLDSGLLSSESFVVEIPSAAGGLETGKGRTATGCLTDHDMPKEFELIFIFSVCFIIEFFPVFAMYSVIFS